MGSRKNIPLTDCLEAVYEYVAKDKILFHDESDAKQEKIRPDAEYARLRKVLKLTDSQIDIFAVIMELSIDGTTRTGDIATRLGITRIKFISLKPDLEVLAAKRYILYNPSRLRNATFLLPKSVLDAIAENRRPSISDLAEESTLKLVQKIDGVLSNYFHDYIDFKTLISELDVLYSCSPGCPLVEAYKRYNLSELDVYEKSLFNYMIARNVCRNENSFAWENYCKLFAESTVISGLHTCIKAGFLILMKEGLVEHDSSEGFEHGDLIRLSEKAIREFLSETAIIESARKNTENQAFRIISHDSFQSKELFFNDREQNELNRLSGLLEQDNYTKVIARLEEKGMRKGVACLFYGAPGTGKTASCYNVSAATGRDIYFVDMAQLKSRWVGESEQNLSNLFKAYHSAVAERELAPIMVWNEADAIFGKRRKVENAVDKMENAMQNIILQELEDFEGILIATTNFSLKEGFDPAMERRFLIKVCFDKPELNTRIKIWRSMFADLSEADARSLATEYDLSGGLIENINRKATVDYILTGQQPNLNYLRKLCSAEISVGSVNKHIGFK